MKGSAVNRFSYVNETELQVPLHEVLRAHSEKCQSLISSKLEAHMIQAREGR